MPVCPSEHSLVNPPSSQIWKVGRNFAVLDACYYYLLHATVVLYTSCCFMYRSVFTVGIALIYSGSFAQADALADYSYINAGGGTNIIYLLARCVTGLSPSGTDNGVLGGLYFKSNRIPNSAHCTVSNHIIFPEPGTLTAGVINIQQCGEFTTAVEGIYTCALMSSAMMNESIRFGIYFSGRSESLNLCIYAIT